MLFTSLEFLFLFLPVCLGVAAYYLIELPGAKLLGAIYGMLNVDGNTKKEYDAR